MMSAPSDITGTGLRPNGVEPYPFLENSLNLPLSFYFQTNQRETPFSYPPSFRLSPLFVAEGGIGQKDFRGIPCSSAETIYFHENGQLGRCRLSTDHDLRYSRGIIRLPRDTAVEFYPSGQVREVEGSGIGIEIQGLFFGLSFGKVGDRDLPSPFNARFYENGQLEEARPLSTQTMVQGLPCEGAVKFYNDGKLKSVELATAQTIQDVPCAAGSTIQFYHDRKLEFAWRLATPQTIQGINGVKCVDFYNSGKLREVTLAMAQTIQGIPCEKEEDVRFNEAGKLTQATLSADFTVNSIQFEKGTILWFYDSGALQSASFPDSFGSVSVRGIPCLRRIGEPVFPDSPSWNKIEFYENGRLKSVPLAEGQTFHGTHFEFGTQVTFDPAGKVKSVGPAAIK